MNCSCPPGLVLHHTLQSLKAQIHQFVRRCLLSTNRVALHRTTKSRVIFEYGGLPVKEISPKVQNNDQLAGQHH
jgi:hypothetical protein